MCKLVILLAILAIAFADPLRSARDTPDGRIIGGDDTSIEEHPHQISLQFYGRHSCGGSIIASNWVLTAAHCVDSGTPRNFKVRAGSAYNDRGGSLHRVAEIIRHEGFRFDQWGHVRNDIALIRVEEPFELDGTRKAIELFKLGEVSQPKAIATITGWGRTSFGTPDILQAAEIPIISKEACYSDYASFGGIGDGQICAAYPDGGKDSCQGDSGGPLTIDGRQAGIVSWGHGCAQPGNPGVYAEVAAFRSWIKEHSRL